MTYYTNPEDREKAAQFQALLQLYNNYRVAFQQLPAHIQQQFYSILYSKEGIVK